MKNNFSHFLASLIAVPVGLIFWVLSSNIFDIHLFLDVLVGIGGFGASYLPTQQVFHKKHLDKYKLTNSEYKYIKEQLNQADEQIKRLRSSYMNIRTIKDAKMIYEINRIIKTIISSVEEEPRKFYRGQQFFHSNLESAVNTIEKYLYLYKMPGKSKQERMQLHETRLSLLELKRTLQSNLSHMNASSYDDLDVERELIKRNADRSKKRQALLTNKLDKEKINLKKDQAKEYVYRGDKNGE
jgi:5-bromo-4-chloroindolyl phosphate hydrolysis protein